MKLRKPSPTAEELLKKILIVQLAQAGVPQLKIREIVGVDIHTVNSVVKYLINK